MIVNVNETYFIDIDDYNHTLKERTGNVDKKGNPVDKTLGYYSSIDKALTQLSRKIVQSSHDELDLSSYLKELRKTTDELISAVRLEGGE